MTASRPVFLGRRQLHQTAAVATTIDASRGTGGIAVRYDEDTVYSITVTGEGRGSIVVAEARVPGIVQSWSATLPSGPVELALESEPPAASLGGGMQPGDWSEMMTSDFVRFVARSGDREEVLARVDGRYLSAETAASFTGRVIGLFAVSGEVVFDSYRYTGSNR